MLWEAVHVGLQCIYAAFPKQQSESENLPQLSVDLQLHMLLAGM